MTFLSPHHHIAARHKTSLHRNITGTPNWGLILAVGASLVMWWGLFVLAHMLIR